METTFFSILIPTYNAGQYLRECLQSVVAQTYKHFECIIVDDASTDDTLAIATEFSALYKFIHVHKNEKNIGLVGNWKRALQLAKGEWIKFLFQDDTLTFDCLAIFSNYTHKDCPLLIGQRNFKIEADTPPSIIRYFKSEIVTLAEHFDKTTLLQPIDIAQLAQMHLAENFIGEPVAVCFHVNIIVEVGNFNSDLKQLVDYEYWLRIGLNFPSIYIAQTVATFRVHGKSASSNSHTTHIYNYYFDTLILYHEYIYNPLFNTLRIVDTQHRNRLIRILYLSLYAFYKAVSIQGNVKEKNHWAYLSTVYPNLCNKWYKKYCFSTLVLSKMPGNFTDILYIMRTMG